MVPDLAGLIGSLSDADVEFIVIGGIALAAHRVIRSTEDVDIVPEPGSENLDVLLGALEILDARLLRNPERGIDASVRQGLHDGSNLTVTTRLGDLDVVQRLPGVPSYEVLAEDATAVEILGVPFRVCSLEHLVAMKRASGRAQDLADLERIADDVGP